VNWPISKLFSGGYGADMADIWRINDAYILNGLTSSLTTQMPDLCEALGNKRSRREHLHFLIDGLIMGSMGSQ
jgi:hypothetical protein